MLAAGIAEQIGVDCGIAIPGRIELLAIRKPTGVLDHHGVLVGQLGAVTLDQRLRDQRINRTLTVHVDGRLAVFGSRHLRQIGRHILDFLASGLLQVLGLGHKRHRQNVRVPGRILSVDAKANRGVDLGTLDLVVVGRGEGLGIHLQRAIRRVLGPGVHELGSVFNVERDALGADAVALLDHVAIALLQHHIRAVGHGHRRIKGDGRLLAELALGGHAGNLALLVRRVGR